jgi:hypothetical protein
MKREEETRDKRRREEKKTRYSNERTEIELIYMYGVTEADIMVRCLLFEGWK